MINYERFLESYKPLIAIPVVITIIALILTLTIGLEQGIDLKGGTTAVIQLEKPVSQSELDALISDGISNNQVEVMISDNQANVEIAGDINVEKLSSILEGTGTISSYRSIGPVLGEEAMNQVYYALAFAFIFMSITVFIIFRDELIWNPTFRCIGGCHTHAYWLQCRH